MCSQKKCKVYSVINADDFQKPLDYGWKREFVKKLVLNTQNGDCGEVYYISPAGQTIKNKKDLEGHLHDDLNPDMFYFAKRALSIEGEIVRTAKPKGYRPTNITRSVDGTYSHYTSLDNVETCPNNIDQNTQNNGTTQHNLSIQMTNIEPSTIRMNTTTNWTTKRTSTANIDRKIAMNWTCETIKTYSKMEAKKSLPIEAPVHSTRYVTNNKSPFDDVASLKQQLKEKDDIIHDLKLCLARKEAELASIPKQQKNQIQISDELLKTEMYKKLPMLTPNQLALMSNEKKRVNWTSDEIATGFAYCYLGKRGYIFTIKNLGIPEPSIRTLQTWGEKMTIAPGELTDCLFVLKSLRSTLREGESQVILCFDEMKCKALYEYNKTLDMIMGPNDQMQTIMVRGLFAKFKQPIYVDFDQKVTPEILMSLITKLHEIDFNVVGCVSDNGGSNVGLWSACGVNYEQTTIKHPETGFNIYMFSDAPHLLKLLRNWFIDGGFLLEDGIELNQGKIRELLKMNTEISPLFKLSLQHLEVVQAQRQNVKMASQLFSHSLAQALFKHFPSDAIAIRLAQFIEMVGYWFDIMNSYSILGIGFKKPYGLGLEHQNEVLDKMYDTIKTMKCYNKQRELQNALQIFQKGILMSITSLKALRVEMDKKFGFKYLLTHRLNQDCLENYHSQMRYRNGANDHPTPVQCLYNLKAIILGKNPGLAKHMHCNTIERDPEEYATSFLNKALPDTALCDSTEEFLDDTPDDPPERLEYNSDDGPEEFVEDISEDVAEEILSHESEDNSNEEIVEERIIDLCIEFVDDVNSNSCEDHTDDITLEFINDLSIEMEVVERKQSLNEDGLEYIAGWIAWKFKDDNPNYSCSRRESLPSHITDHSYAKKIVLSDSWIDYYSYGGLTKPSKQVFEWVRELEREFLEVHGEAFSHLCNVKRKLIDKLKENCPQVPNEVVALFARSRIYMRCKFLNQKRMEEAILKKKERKQNELLKRKNMNITDDASRSKRKKMNKIIL